MSSWLVALVSFSATLFLATRWGKSIHRAQERRFQAQRSQQHARGPRRYRATTAEDIRAKQPFYSDKSVIETRWYLHDPDLPDRLGWARLRVFDDGTADSTFSERGTAFGFVNADYASYILTEDEYERFNPDDPSDGLAEALRQMDPIAPPTWTDATDKPFEFLGTY